MTKPRLVRVFGVWAVQSTLATDMVLHEAAVNWSVKQWKRENP